MFVRLFLNHPRSVNESYFEHMLFAGWFSVTLFAAGCAALVHALVPALFEKTAGNLISKMHHRLHNRKG